MTSPPPQDPRSRLHSRQQPLPVTLLPFPPSTQTDSALCHRSPSEKHHREGETLPVFGETVPVRVKSGHFPGFFGIAPGRKSAFRSLRDLMLELYSTLISFSDVKDQVQIRKLCRFYEKPCRIGLARGESGHLTGPDNRIPQPPGNEGGRI